MFVVVLRACWVCVRLVVVAGRWVVALGVRVVVVVVQVGELVVGDVVVRFGWPRRVVAVTARVLGGPNGMVFSVRDVVLDGGELWTAYDFARVERVVA